MLCMRSQQLGLGTPVGDSFGQDQCTMLCSMDAVRSARLFWRLRLKDRHKCYKTSIRERSVHVMQILPSAVQKITSRNVDDI